MFKPFSKVVVVALMLIAFVGQAFAYTSMSCEMSADTHQSHMTMDHSSMDHSSMDNSSMSYDEGMDHTSMKTSASNSEDCCGVDCVCPVNACASVIVLNADNGSSEILSLSEAVLSHLSQQPNYISTSLYRPPIFA